MEKREKIEGNRDKKGEMEELGKKKWSRGKKLCKRKRKEEVWKRGTTGAQHLAVPKPNKEPDSALWPFPAVREGGKMEIPVARSALAGSGWALEQRYQHISLPGPATEGLQLSGLMEYRSPGVQSPACH